MFLLHKITLTSFVHKVIAFGEIKLSGHFPSGLIYGLSSRQERKEYAMIYIIRNNKVVIGIN